jgi:hypothetical protein
MTAVRRNRRVALVTAAVVASGAFAFLLWQRGGAAACYAGDPAAPSAPADPALFAGAADANGPNQLAVEMVSGELLGTRSRIAVRGGEILGISGWAVDIGAKQVARAVLVRIDGAPPLRADTCGERPDVGRFFGEPAYARAGYGLRVRPTAGVHHLSFDVLSSDGRTIYRNARDLELDASQPLTPTGAPATPAAAVVQGGFTYLDDATIPQPVFTGAAFVHPVGTDLRIAGWIVDRTHGAPAPVRSVEVLVDGRPVDRAAYGQSRPDVASFVGAPQLQNAGFTARVFTDDLSPGRHSLTLRAVLSDGRTATLGSSLVIGLTRPATP